MKLVDTHCHLQSDAFDEDREEVLARSLDELDWLIVVGDDVASSSKAIEMVNDRVFATAGIHPHNAANADKQSLDQIREYACQSGVVAIGEIGLDYYYDFSPRESQKNIFTAQLEMAAELKKPVVIHCREAQDDVKSILSSLHKDLSGGVMHCFPGDSAFARACLDFGFYISFAGNVTFKKAVELREAAEIVPMERLLVETDSPYLAPVPVRGKRCEPAYVIHTAKLLSELKGISLPEFIITTSDNAGKLFNINK